MIDERSERREYVHGHVGASEEMRGKKKYYFNNIFLDKTMNLMLI